MKRQTPTIDQAIREAKKKLPFTPRKQQNQMLEYAADDKAEAYRIGAEEAQSEIIARLLDLKAADAQREVAEARQKLEASS